MRLRLLLVTLCTLVMSGCRTRYVPIEMHHYHDSIRIVTATDSIYRIDSVILYQSTDTVIIRERSIINNYKTRLEEHRARDSVPTNPTQIMQLVEQAIADRYPPRRTKPSATLFWLGFLSALVLYITYRLTRTYVKLRIWK